MGVREHLPEAMWTPGPQNNCSFGQIHLCPVPEPGTRDRSQQADWQEQSAGCLQLLHIAVGDEWALGSLPPLSLFAEWEG